jgi:erythromycin esterase-like protein
MQSVEADLDDLIGMKEFFQDVRIVGIGETTHGTGDFIKLKD